MTWLYVKNWYKYQHYKQRHPPWIKLHKTLLDDMAFMSLPPAARSLLMQLWILASENDGKLTSDINIIRFRLRWDNLDAKFLNLLINQGFLSFNASVCLQPQADAPKCLSRDRDRGEEETESDDKTPSSPADAGGDGEKNDVVLKQAIDGIVDVVSGVSIQAKVETAFDCFWQAYPKKVGKGAARKAWARVKNQVETAKKALEALAWQVQSEQWVKDGGQFIPHPATYINQQRWEDQPPSDLITSTPEEAEFLSRLQGGAK